jgi:hypothetical protein
MPQSRLEPFNKWWAAASKEAPSNIGANLARGALGGALEISSKSEPIGSAPLLHPKTAFSCAPASKHGMPESAESSEFNGGRGLVRLA